MCETIAIPFYTNRQGGKHSQDLVVVSVRLGKVSREIKGNNIPKEFYFERGEEGVLVSQ